jgi:hypothetical protein
MDVAAKDRVIKFRPQLVSIGDVGLVASMKWGFLHRDVRNDILLKHVKDISDFDLYNPIASAFEV